MQCTGNRVLGTRNRKQGTDMRPMSNLDYTYIVQELQPLVGKRLDKFYELGEGLFRMKIGSESVIIELGKRLHITKLLEEAPEPTGFAMKVRKELGGRRLEALRQKEKDRIVVFDFGGKELVAEMFGNGNLIVLEKGKILAVYERKEWKGRNLKPGEEYSFPPYEEKGIKELLADLGERPVAAELVPLNIGINYVKKVLAAAGVDEGRPGKELSASERKRIADVYVKRMDSLKPSVIIRDGKPADYSLFNDGEPFESLSAALDACFGVAEEENPELKRLEAMLAKQRERLAELEREAEEAKGKGDLVFEKYAEVEEALEAYKAGGLEAVEMFAKKKGWKLDKKKKEVEMEF